MVGCGTGRLAEYISEIIGNKGHIYSIDPAEYRIKVARKKIKDKNRPNISFEVGKSEDLSCFTDKSFDIVVMNVVFGWIADKKTTLAGVYRVLKPDGLLGITTPENHREMNIRCALSLAQGFNVGRLYRCAASLTHMACHFLRSHLRRIIFCTGIISIWRPSI